MNNQGTPCQTIASLPLVYFRHFLQDLSQPHHKKDSLYIKEPCFIVPQHHITLLPIRNYH